MSLSCRIVSPWRESIRYTARKAGYHGGASLAEMTVPVLMFVPDPDALPAGWLALAPERAVPGWWSASQPATAEDRALITPAPTGRTKRRPTAQQPDALFDTEATAQVPHTIGRQVVTSTAYQAQQRYVRKPPATDVVATIIDTLVRSGGRLSTTALAELADTPPIRVPGLVAMLRGLLNVEGYPVLALIDGGQTIELDRELLHSQFELGPVPS